MRNSNTNYMLNYHNNNSNGNIKKIPNDFNSNNNILEKLNMWGKQGESSKIITHSHSNNNTSNNFFQQNTQDLGNSGNDTSNLNYLK